MVALFHMPGITARKRVRRCSTEPGPIGQAEIAQFLARHAAPGASVVLFAAPQLSLSKSPRWRRRGRAANRARHARYRRDLAEIKARCRSDGLNGSHKSAGAVVAPGICFYQSYARQMAEADRWTVPMTNSAKLKHSGQLWPSLEPGGASHIASIRR